MSVQSESTVTYTLQGSVGVAEISNPPVNAINRAVRSGLSAALDRAVSDPGAKALLIVSAGRVFMAGADITEFGGAAGGPTLQELEAALEAAPLPVVAAIQGMALGGGLELAMSCHYRIASPDAKLGLPEITLGLIPGAGGTQRLPRLIGAGHALDMMLSGAPISAAQGAERGLIDEVAAGDLREAAMVFCRRLVMEGQGPRPTRDLTVREALSDAVAAEALAKHARTIKGLTAPSLVVDAIKAASLPFDQGMRVEAKLADHSLELRESHALRHLFFAERLAGKTPGTSGDALAPIRTAAVIGAGTMGGGIAQAFADAGLSVILVDSEDAALKRGIETIRSNYAASVKRGRIDQPTADQRLGRITPSTNLADAGTADVVIEAVFEDMDIKKRVLRALDALVPPERLIASNTSTLSVTELARATAHPRRFAGLHFFSPAHIMKLLEIVRGEDTAPQTLGVALQVSRVLKKIAVVANDGFGFIGNRMMLDGYFREAEQLMLEGASPGEVDSALERFGFAMGPQRVSDLGGTDVGTKARAQLYKRENRPDPYFVIADELTRLGRLGQKSGSGFYRYASGGRDALPDSDVSALIEQLAAQRGIVRRSIPEDEIVERCVLSLILMGARVLEEGIASRASDVDVVWTSGYGFPRHLGGPLFHADTLGLGSVAQRIRVYHSRYGHYWRPASLIDQLAAEGSGFVQWDQSRRRET
ncbi:MAG TPA: 3-hydroxyacyl-CoA dehydrogenase NAD-binding domain-containing protein [Steroidobacteraceae bacterium]|nr:3-hydroxyacyl-CoA dehydrogenase NAD-binding domain-containing protein [Steroidobacteraceae bacterium]